MNEGIAEIPGRFRGAVFDLDGTLIDSEPAWEKAKRIVAARRGRPISDAQIAASVGCSMDRLVADVFAPAAARAIEDEIFALGEEWLDRLRQPIPGATDFLRALRGLGLPIAICSSSREHLIRAALAQLGIGDAVGLVVSADPLPRRKPDPLPYLVTAERMGLAPGDLIAFEDAPSGACSAKAAGLYTVAIGPEAMEPQMSFCDLHAQDYPALCRLLGL
ncbi:MAG: HAD family hydrolase [Paracoccus sp. (in: a-proteobacteria)]